jgi:hypothetical protein
VRDARVWIGSGLDGIDGLAAGDPVTAEQMRALFGCGLHPLAELRQQQLEGPDLTATHLAIGLAIRGCQAGHRVLFATTANGSDKLADTHSSGRLQTELARLSRYPLLVVDEVGYIPFEPEAANLFFQLVSSRYERASLIVTSNKPFGRWGEVFGDEVVAAAMIDRLVQPPKSSPSAGDSYRLKNRDLGRAQPTRPTPNEPGTGQNSPADN